MHTSRLDRLAPLTGIAFVALLVVGYLLMGVADYFPTQERALEIFSANPDQVQLGAILGGFYGIVFLVWFVGCLSTALRSKSDRGDRLAAIAFGGGVIIAISIACALAIISVAADRAGRPGGISAETAVIYYDLYSTIMAAVVSSGLAILIGAAGIASLQTRLFPAWFGWTSIVVAVGLLSPIHYIFEAVAVAWIVVASIMLFLQRQGVAES